MSDLLRDHRDAGKCMELAEAIRDISTRQFNIMEVCGGHTMAIRKSGIDKLVGENIDLISGPGCPVCVTAIEDIDKITTLAEIDDVVICTFGDLFYVPGSETDLAGLKAKGADVRIVYSVHDVLVYAANEPDKKFIFVSIGFETTVPTTAAAVLEAEALHLENFFILGVNKTMPKALRAVLDTDESKINALICPGHVSAITGTGIYTFIVDELALSCCITGFEPLDILKSIYILTELWERGETKLINAYQRVVKNEGNLKALAVIDEVFEPADVPWRGFGVIPGSGLEVKDKYARFNARVVFNTREIQSEEYPACICGDILRGIKKPSDCTLFGKVCTPDGPKGACMVSSEGACAAWYRYK